MRIANMHLLSHLIKKEREIARDTKLTFVGRDLDLRFIASHDIRAGA